MISGRPATRGSSNAQKKSNAQGVHVANLPRRKSKTSEPIMFSYWDLEGIQLPYDDAIVVTVKVGDVGLKAYHSSYFDD